MTFGEAIEALRAGKCVQRDCWNEVYIMLGDGEIVLRSDNLSLDGYTPTHEAIFALDWKEVE